LAKPFTESEMKKAKELDHKWNMAEIEESYPVSFIGTGADLNTATENCMARAASLFNVTVPEIMNRATINGSIDIGRKPGDVTVTFLAPKKHLKQAGLWNTVRNAYLKFTSVHPGSGRADFYWEPFSYFRTG